MWVTTIAENREGLRGGGGGDGRVASTVFVGRLVQLLLDPSMSSSCKVFSSGVLYSIVELSSTF